MQNKVIGVIAPKGSGKTTVVADLVRQTPRVAVYDPMAATDVQYRMAASDHRAGSDRISQSYCRGQFPSAVRTCLAGAGWRRMVLPGFSALHSKSMAARAADRPHDGRDR